MAGLSLSVQLKIKLSKSELILNKGSPIILVVTLGLLFFLNELINQSPQIIYNHQRAPFLLLYEKIW